MGRRRSTREWTEARHGRLAKVVGCRVAAVAPSLRTHGRHLGHLMRLLSVVHHLLVCPLSELGVGGVVIGHLSLLVGMAGVGMNGVRLLVGILIELRVELLGVDVGGPGSLLLLLDGVRVGRLLLLLLRRRHGWQAIRRLLSRRGWWRRGRARRTDVRISLC